VAGLIPVTFARRSKSGDRQDNLLIIAPNVPRHDWSSGEFRLWSMLRLLIEKYGIHYLPLSLPPTSQKYIHDLESIGVTVLPEDTSLAGLLREYPFKAVILEFYDVAEYYLPRIRLLQPACRVIVDTVDVHFLREEMMGRVTGDPEILRKAADTKRRELRVYSRADVVVTVTEEDGRALTGECPRVSVRVVPNIHELVPVEGPAKGSGLIFVGGFNHPPNIDAILYFCREILPLIRNHVPDVRVAIVGSNPPAAVLALRDEGVTVTGFVPSTTPYLHASRVSIAPLRFGAGMKGKVGEAMAHGVPVVTTTVGAQGMRLQHGVNVLIADEPASFASAVVQLLSDEGFSDLIKSNAINHLARHFTPRQVAPRLNSILEELDTSPARTLSMYEKAHFLGGWALDNLHRRLWPTRVPRPSR
jgi:glycosyltransferase involved in cell wall biosynthesis